MSTSRSMLTRTKRRRRFVAHCVPSLLTLRRQRHPPKPMSVWSLLILIHFVLSSPHLQLAPGLKDPLYDVAAGSPAAKKPEPLYDKAGNFVYTRYGKPVMDTVPIYFDKTANPIYDYAGNPLYNKSGKPLYDKAANFQWDKIGNPIYDRAGNPAYYKPRTPIYDKAGVFLPFYDRAGNLVFDDEGKFIASVDIDPVYDIAQQEDKPSQAKQQMHLNSATDPVYDYSSADPIYELAGKDTDDTTVDGLLLDAQVAGVNSSSDPMYDIATQENGYTGAEVWPVSPSVAGQAVDVSFMDGDDVCLQLILKSASFVPGPRRTAVRQAQEAGWTVRSLTGAADPFGRRPSSSACSRIAARRSRARTATEALAAFGKVA